jgi:hypothetical protein
MGSRKPKTLAELFEFYYEDIKPLYCHLQASNTPPVEMLFEINAAWDHLSRHWHYGETEEETVDVTAAHLKRAAFDAFKIVLRETLDRYQKLNRLDTSIVDNGDFDKKMHVLAADIKQKAGEARMAEGDSRDPEKWHQAFDVWQEVYLKCALFAHEFYLNPKVEWARHKNRQRDWWHRAEGFVLAVLSGLVVWLLTKL